MQIMQLFFSSPLCVPRAPQLNAPRETNLLLLLYNKEEDDDEEEKSKSDE